MRAVVQRVSRAEVSVAGRCVGRISHGLLVYLGIAEGDTDADLRWMVDKILGLRIFADPQGQMNRALADVGGQVLSISQFTLLGDARKGRRPSFVAAMRPEHAKPMFERFVAQMAQGGAGDACGEFGAHMHVDAVNDGPVTLLLDSQKLF
ncbi:MAG: D-aminoacyl-tRNA deacylase [Proteobacteria bacterium]|nr:D-aminoacyl-tRNA deacylase [Pseudomonadota bacterium]